MKKSKLLIQITIAVLIFSGIAWFASPSRNQKTSEPTYSLSKYLSAESSWFNFGSISMANGMVSNSFTVKNSGDQPIAITKIFTSCMCTTAKLLTANKSFGPYGMPGHGFTPSINEFLAPNEEATVEVTFDPAAHGPAGVGPIERIIYIENSDGMLELGIKAEVKP